MQVLDKCLDVLLNLVEQIQGPLAISFSTAGLLLFHVKTSNSSFQLVLEISNFLLFSLQQIHFLVDFHDECVPFVDLLLTVLAQLFQLGSHAFKRGHFISGLNLVLLDLDFLVTVCLHELNDLSLEVLVLGHDVEVLLLHHLIVSHDFLDTLLRLLVLSESAHEDLVIKLQLLHLLSIACTALCLTHGLLEVFNQFVALLQLVGQLMDALVLACKLFTRDKVGLYSLIRSVG